MYYTYILTDSRNDRIYIGVTNCLARRLEEHQRNLIDGYTKRFHICKPVYYEIFEDVNNAIAREKQLKRWTRCKKDMLIVSKNPDWEDLSEQIFRDQNA